MAERRPVGDLAGLVALVDGVGSPAPEITPPRDPSVTGGLPPGVQRPPSGWCGRH